MNYKELTKVADGANLVQVQREVYELWHQFSDGLGRMYQSATDKDTRSYLRKVWDMSGDIHDLILKLDKGTPVKDSADGVDVLDIDNYYGTEDGMWVGSSTLNPRNHQYVEMQCISDPSAAQSNDIEDDYPYVYEVTVYINYGEDDEQSAMGVAKQWSSEDSAWYDGFLPAYKRACAKLGIKAMYK